MSESYQVMKADFKEAKAATDQWAEKHIYALMLDPMNGGEPIGAEELRHHRAGPPQQGEHVEGEIRPGQYPGQAPTFKRARKEETAAPRASSGLPIPQKPSDGYRGMDPQREAQIIRQHSQQMAIMWSAVLQREGKLPDTNDRGLKALIDYFDLDVRQNAGKSE